MYVRVVHGPADAEPVILIHGLGVSGAYFRPLAKQLRGLATIYIPDLPGHGRSPNPREPLDALGLASALRDWMAKTGIGRASLVGHSMGCQVAIEVARQWPELVGRLVLIGLVPDPAGRGMWTEFRQFLIDVPFERMSLVPIVARDYLRMIGPRFLAEFRFMREYPIEQRLVHVCQPVLLIRGERDPLVPESWAALAAEMLRARASIAIPGHAHAVHFSAPEQVAACIRPFLT